MTDVQRVEVEPCKTEWHVSRIWEAWQGTVTGIIETGRRVQAAKDDLPDQGFSQMVREDLPFGRRTAYRLMDIANDPRLVTHVSQLPSSWGTLAEITRLGLALGADRQTFAGLSGIGDLVVTAFSRHSRNRRLGVELGEGRKFKEIMADMGMVAEGVFTAQSVSDLARKLQVDMPICHQVHAVLFQDKDPHRAITDLMTRGLRDETIT